MSNKKQEKSKGRSKMPQLNHDMRYAESFEYFTPDGFQSLRSYLGRVRDGQPKIYTAPFAKGEPISKVLNEWQEVLVSIENKWPSLYQFEMDLRAKVGPLSVQYPLSQRMEDVFHYFDDVRTSSQLIEPQAIMAVQSEFAAIGGLRMRTSRNTVDIMKKSTNSGNPYFTKRRNVVEDTLPCEVFGEYTARHGYVVTQRIGAQQIPWDSAAVIGWRGQEGGPTVEDVKQRVVWMFPFAVNIAELQIYQPFIEAAQRTGLVPAWVGMDLVDRRVTKLFDTKAENDPVVCTDFTRFDQHFNSSLQIAAQATIESVMHHDRYNKLWIEEVFPIKYNIPMILEAYDEDLLYIQGMHGMASGSGGTNVDETLAHRALQHEVAMWTGKTLNPNSQCLGDDGILSYPGITVEDVVERYSLHGLEMNAEKQYSSTQDCVYLRRWHHKDYRLNKICVGVYSTMRAIGRLRYLERFMDPQVWSPEAVALRQLSIIENCKWHPLREEFAQFCMKRDKFRLGIDIPGFLANIEKYAQESIELMPDFLGYTKTLQGEGIKGMSKWWIVQYLKSRS